MDDCAATIKAVDEAEAKVINAYFELRDDDYCSVVVVRLFCFQLEGIVVLMSLHVGCSRLRV